MEKVQITDAIYQDLAKMFAQIIIIEEDENTNEK